MIAKLFNKLTSEGTNAMQAFQLMRFGAAILISILLVKFGFEKTEVGEVEYFLFVSYLLSFALAGGIRNGILSYFPSLTLDSQKKLVFASYVILMALGSLVVLGFQVLGSICNNAFLEEYGFVIGLYVLLNAPTVISEIIFFLDKSYRSLVFYGAGIFSIELILILAILVLNGNVKDILWAFIAWAFIKHIILVVQVIRLKTWRFDLILAKKFIRFFLPLTGVALLANSMEMVDGLLVEYMFSTEEFAVFRFGARELPITLVLVGAVVTALIPIAVTNTKDAVTRLKSESQKLMWRLYPLAIVLMLLSPIIYPLVYSDDYKLSATIFNVYLLILASRIIMPQVILLAKHQNSLVLRITLIELVVNVILSILFIQYYGLIGIAFATVIAYMVQKSLLLFFLKRRYNITLPHIIDVKTYLGFNIVLVSAFFISLYY